MAKYGKLSSPNLILCCHRSGIYLHQRRRTLAIVSAKSCGCLGLLLRVWFIAQLLDSARWSVGCAPKQTALSSPSLVDFPLVVGFEVGLALKPFRTFFAVPLAQARQILGGLCVLELGEVLWVVQISVDLVEVAGMSARLLLRVLSPDGGHGDCLSTGKCGRGFGLRTVGLAAVGAH